MFMIAIFLFWLMGIFQFIVIISSCILAGSLLCLLVITRFTTLALDSRIHCINNTARSDMGIEHAIPVNNIVKVMMMQMKTRSQRREEKTTLYGEELSGKLPQGPIIIMAFTMPYHSLQAPPHDGHKSKEITKPFFCRLTHLNIEYLILFKMFHMKNCSIVCRISRRFE